MSTNNYNVFSEVVTDLNNDVKLFLLTKLHLLLITLDDSIIQYSLSDKKQKKIYSFCNDKVVKVYSSHSYIDTPHFMALTMDGQVFSWGCNSEGQLGNGTLLSCEEPKLIKSLQKFFVTDMCCGNTHSIALMRNGDVYAFGCNKKLQCGTYCNEKQIFPHKMNVENVIAIACGDNHSIVLTQNGEVHGWGSNEFSQLGLDNDKKSIILKQLEVPKIDQIMCGHVDTILLTSDGDIYFCGRIGENILHKSPTAINGSQKFIKIAASLHSELYVSLSSNNFCFIFGKYDFPSYQIVNEIQQTEFMSIEETFAYYQQITYQWLEIKKYKNYFIEICSLGIGGFSTVFKCQMKNDNDKVYAMKKVSFKAEDKYKVTRELKFLFQLSSTYVVKLFDSWIENNYYINSIKNEQQQFISLSNLLYDPHLPNLLHLQMELCPLTLREAIDKLKQYCITLEKSLSFIGYYISSELLYEILECVQYLHTYKPEIIHRDLKPENILLTNFVNNRFVKLSDFGLSTFHVFANQSHTKNTGDKNYRAFEINNTSKYTTKADIFSLGMVIQELFHINSCYHINSSKPFLEQKFNYLSILLKDMLSFNIDDRPTCNTILSNRHLWLLTDEQLKNDEEFNSIINKELKAISIEENFIEYFVQKKYNSVSHKVSEINPNSITKFDDYDYYRVGFKRLENDNLSIVTINKANVNHPEFILKVGDEVISTNNVKMFSKDENHVLQELQCSSMPSILIKRKRIVTDI